MQGLCDLSPFINFLRIFVIGLPNHTLCNVSCSKFPTTCSLPQSFEQNRTSPFQSTNLLELLEHLTLQQRHLIQLGQQLQVELQQQRLKLHREQLQLGQQLQAEKQQQHLIQIEVQPLVEQLVQAEQQQVLLKQVNLLKQVEQLHLELQPLLKQLRLLLLEQIEQLLLLYPQVKQQKQIEQLIT